MDTNTSQSDYLLLFRNNTWYQDLSPEEIQRVMTEWMAWFDNLVADGRCLGGQSLEHDGRVVLGESRHVTDGPYAEAKESVAGYFMLRVADLDEADRGGDNQLAPPSLLVLGRQGSLPQQIEFILVQAALEPEQEPVVE